jgi:Na+/alanine symporter
MILGMAFPNILGLLLLSNNVKDELMDYEKIKRKESKLFDK